MQQKQTLVLGGTLVVLLIIAWISGVFDRNPSNVNVPELDLPTSEVTHISVTLPDITLKVKNRVCNGSCVNPWICLPIRQPSHAS